jgi:hypothetical protein
MAFYDLVWYTNAGDQSTTGHYAVAKRPQNAAVTAGQLVRQFTAPAVGSERCFACIIAGTTANVTDATWVLTRGAKTTDGTATWQECTGASAVNGDLTNTPTWAAAKAISSAVTLGAIIQRNNGASYWICSTAGSTGASEPAWANNTAGTTQADSTVTWTCLGVVGNFTGGQAPHARLGNAGATTWFAANNTIYVGDNHAESQATAITIAPVSSGAGNLGRILCHNHSGSYPPASTDLRATATVTTTAAVNITLTFQGMYTYGLIFQAGSGVSTGASIVLGTSSIGNFFDNCSLQLLTTFSTSSIAWGVGAGNNFIFNNTSVKFSNVGQSITAVNNGNFIWQNTAPVLASGSSVPNNLFNMNSPGGCCNVVLEALDLSAITGNVVNYANPMLGSVIVKDCKLNASSAFVTPGNSSEVIQVVRSDSGATGYKSARYQYEGTETTETSITRVGGASDPTGQAQSRKIVTTANAQWLRPFKAEPYAQWNPRTATNVTVTVCGTINAGALPNNDDIWLEVEYLGSSSSPLGTIVTTTKANVLAANAAVASDSSTWNNTPNTFDPATVVNTTLSNGNLTATHSNTTGNSGARFLGATSTGKYYFEITQTTTGHGLNDTVGLITSAGAVNDVVTGGNGAIGVTRGGNINVFSTNQVTGLGTFAAGDVAGIAIDFGNLLVWVRRNAGNWNNSGTANPATGVGGVLFAAGSLTPAVCFTGTGTAAGDSNTINIGGSAFANAAPSGFGIWASYTSFKLTATLSAPQPGMAGYLHARVRAAKPSTTWYIDPQITLS